MERDKTDPSRRQVACGMATAVAATLTAGSASAEPPPGARGQPAPPLRNPVTAYPKPPFPRQSQAWPGLQSMMTPRPDCGERSYRGTGRLLGRHALLTGGDSGIGRAAAIAFAREGADVAINYLPAEEPDARPRAAMTGSVPAGNPAAIACPHEPRAHAARNLAPEDTMTSFVRPCAALATFAVTLTLATLASAAPPPSTAEVLGKLHRSNLEEIEAGKMARAHGNSAEAKSFGKTLVEDHTAADKKVRKLAKEEKIDLTANTPAAQPMPQMPMGSGFDTAFGKVMVQDHDKAIAEVKAARDATEDPKLKSLLEAVLPVLEKHREMAQKLAGSAKS